MATAAEFSELLERISKVKLRGGVVGKVSIVLIVLILVIGAIAYHLNALWVSVAAIVLLAILTLVLLFRLIRFAERNPHAALFEGAEFLVHEQMKLGMKSQPVLPEPGP